MIVPTNNDRYSPPVFQRIQSNRYFDASRFEKLISGTLQRHHDRLLAVYFAALSYLVLARHYTELLGVDAAIYYRAATAYARGLSPWDALVVSPGGHEYHFAALPPTVLVMLPFTAMNERAFVWLWLALSVGSAFWIVRRLKLQWWWVMFPPLIEGVYVANPQIVLLALLLAGWSLLAALAPMLKIYAVVPLVGERRYGALLLTLGLLAASVLVAPGLWSEYVARNGEISGRIIEEAEGGYSAFGSPEFTLLITAAAGIALLAAVDLSAAGWLAAPAVFPAAQFHLSTMAMPVLARVPNTLLILALAFPARGLSGAAIGLYGAWRCYSVVRARRLRKADPTV